MANAINALNINNNNYVITVPYGICSTSAGTTAKTISVDKFSLESGAIIAVKFTNGNTANSPTLNVNSLGAKPIYYKGTAATKGLFETNKIYELIYNGEQWDLVGDINNTNIAIGKTADAKTTTEALTNGNVYLNFVENDAVKSSRKITGSGATTVTADTSGNITIKSTDTNTHYTTGLKVGNAASATVNTAATNGNVYLNVLDDTTVRDSHKIVGSGATTVTSDANGVITISSTDSNTVYTHPTTSGNKHIPSGGSSGQILRWSADGTAAWGADNNTVYTHPTTTARTGVPTSNQTPGFGGTFTVNQVSNDAAGHVTAITSRTVTIPNATATTSASGLMSAADKTKLDGITAGAAAVQIITWGTND